MNEVPMDECEEDNVVDIRKRPLNTLIVYGNDEHQFKLSIHDLLKMKETNDLIRSEMNELKTSSNLSAVKKPNSTHASFNEIPSLYAFFAVFAAFS